MAWLPENTTAETGKAHPSIAKPIWRIGSACEHGARLAADLFDTPIVGIALVRGDSVSFHPEWDATAGEYRSRDVPLPQTFVANVLRDTTRPLVVPDALLDPRFAQHSTVIGAPHVRFFAGAAIVTPDRGAIGALCVADRQPRPGLSEVELNQFTRLAALIAAQFATAMADRRKGAVGLPGRAQLLDHLAEEPQDPAYLVVVDVMESAAFQAALRVLGPAGTDELVNEAARRLQDLMPSWKPLYHLDSCRFAFVRAGDADATAKRLDQLSRKLDPSPISQAHPVLPGQARLGAAPLVPANPDAVLRTAVAAVQDAAELQRDWILHDPERDAAQRRAFTVLSTLRSSLLEPTHFRLHWQPRVDLRTGRCVAAEALLRWRHPELGMVPPAEFIPLAERTALMPRLTDFVLRQAADQLRIWRSEGVFIRASINVSARDLDEALGPRLQRLLESTGLPGDAIEVELTESMEVRHPELLRQRLDAVRALGIRLAIDDFGTGHSNLSYLRQLPATVVKLDRSLIASLGSQQRDRTIVQATLAMLRDLGLRTVAEGVEDGATAALLRDWGCDEGQGYLYARPMEPDAFAAWLRNASLSQVPAAAPKLEERPERTGLTLEAIGRMKRLLDVLQRAAVLTKENMAGVDADMATLKREVMALQRLRRVRPRSGRRTSQLGRGTR